MDRDFAQGGMLVGALSSREYTSHMTTRAARMNKNPAAPQYAHMDISVGDMILINADVTDTMAIGKKRTEDRRFVFITGEFKYFFTGVELLDNPACPKMSVCISKTDIRTSTVKYRKVSAMKYATDFKYEDLDLDNPSDEVKALFTE